MLSFYLLVVLDEILDLTESVSEGFPTYFCRLLWKGNMSLNWQILCHEEDSRILCKQNQCYTGTAVRPEM